MDDHLVTLIEQGFAHVNTRLGDVIARLDNINGTVGDHRHAIGVHGAQLQTHTARLEELGRRTHDHAGHITRLQAAAETKPAHQDQLAVTRGDIRLIVLIVLGTSGAVAAVYQWVLGRFS
jgi:hypothetical protein